MTRMENGVESTVNNIVKSRDMRGAKMTISVGDLIPSNFSHIVPLFPLPNLVVFPGVVQPLHIFEPRYRAMMQWTLKHERLIAMSLLKPGWEGESETAPHIQPTICIAKIIAHRKLDDGRFHLLIAGGRRAKIQAELSAPQPFRTAQVALLDDCFRPDEDQQREHRIAALTTQFLQYLQRLQVKNEQICELMNKGVSYSLLTDLVASVLPLETEYKYQMLAECNVDARAEFLLSQFVRMNEISPHNCTSRTEFPPQFSRN
jgi:uncharacterized protein